MERQTVVNTSNVIKLITIHIDRLPSATSATHANWEILQKHLGFNIRFVDNHPLLKSPQVPFIHSITKSNFTTTTSSSSSNGGKTGDKKKDKQSELQVGDILMEVNGRRVFGMGEHQLASLFRQLMQPLMTPPSPSSVTSKDTPVSKLGEVGMEMKFVDGKVYKVQLEEEIVRDEMKRVGLTLTLMSPVQSQLDQIQISKASAVAYSEVILVRQDIRELLCGGGNVTIYDFLYLPTEVDWISRDGCGGAKGGAKVKYFMIELGVGRPKSVSDETDASDNPETIERMKKAREEEEMLIPDTVIIEALTPLTYELWDSAKNASRSATLTSERMSLDHLLPPVFRLVDGQLQTGDNVWRINQTVVTRDQLMPKATATMMKKKTREFVSEDDEYVEKAAEVLAKCFGEVSIEILQRNRAYDRHQFQIMSPVSPNSPNNNSQCVIS